jgi:hypothetical protein
MTNRICVTAPSCADASPGVLDPKTRIRAEREQLTHLLRSLASELDELDRRLSDITWRHRAQHARPADGGTDREQTILTMQRDRLTGRLQGLASRLKDIDMALSGPAVDRWPSVHVGTCPDCGYPSLGSGLCASCRLYLVP